MENNEFKYDYTAPTSEERKEIEGIRNNYLKEKEPTNLKLERLRKLDRKIRAIPEVVALILGVGGILIFGLGLTLILEWNLLIWGIIINVVGLIPMLIAYPLYIKTSNKLKNKHIEEILKLSEELLNDENK